MGGERELLMGGFKHTKRRERDKEMRQEDQKCVYEGRTATGERGGGGDYLSWRYKN